MLNSDDVKHIAKLAKIQVSDTEAKKYAVQLSSVLEFFEQLQEVNTEKVEETSQVTGLTNQLREDQIIDLKLQDKLLSCTPNQVESHSVKIPKIM
jgi:aspartyl-tRNA(Asn)/glutamyl-tRNA(Gln) amidotransferase subunit C